MASEADPTPALAMIGQHLQPDQTVHVGVIDTCNDQVESPDPVCERV